MTGARATAAALALAVLAVACAADPRPAGDGEVTSQQAQGAMQLATERHAPPRVARGDGVLHMVPGTSPRAGTGRLRRYSVAVEGRLGIDPRAVAETVQRTLADDRSWTHAGRLTLQRVDSGPVDFQVVLASQTLTDRLCAPLTTEGRYSCGTATRAVLNAMRWLKGAAAYKGRLAAYRQYLINHEVGHTLGRRHAACPAPGRLAPVMMQQTLGVGRCRPSPWPFP